jgi:hypothetical protein
VNVTRSMGRYRFRFTLDETPRIRAKIVADLDRIVHSITRNFPQATIVLSGSFSYGEGKIREEGDRIVNASDYDIYVILRSPILVISALKSPELKRIGEESQSEEGFSLDLTILWKGFLDLGLTSVSGTVIQGDPEIGRLIDRVPISRRKLQVSQLKVAYLHLLDVLSGADGASLQDVLIPALRCFLGCHGGKGEQAHPWKDYFSLLRNLEMLHRYEGDLNPDLFLLIRSALANRLNPGIPFEPPARSAALAEDFLKDLVSRLRATFRWTDYLQFLAHEIRHLRFTRLLFDPNKIMLQASASLVKAIRRDGGVHGDELVKVKKMLGMEARREASGDDEVSLACCREALRNLGSVHLHKVSPKGNL